MAGGTILPAVREIDNATKSETLREHVENLPWEAVIQPSARHVFSLPLEALPKGYVVELPEDVDTHMQNASCYDISKSEVPAMGDHYLFTALEQRSVDIEDADFAFIPYYQGCYFNYLHENTYKKLADSVAVAETQIILSEKLKASNIVVPFTHDWGSVSRINTVRQIFTLTLPCSLFSAPGGGLSLRMCCRAHLHHQCPKQSRGKSMGITTLDASKQNETW